jgi:hypothetical protein
MSTLHSLFEIRDFILRVLPCNFMSFSELVLSAVLSSLVVSVLGNCAADPRSSPRLCSFFYHVYKGYGDHNISFTFTFLHFFFFLIFLTFQKGRSAVGFSTCYDGNCLLLCNTVHNASLSIWPLAFTLLCKCLFILARRKSPSQSLCVRLFGKFHFVRATPSTGNNKDTISCL